MVSSLTRDNMNHWTWDWHFLALNIRRKEPLRSERDTTKPTLCAEDVESLPTTSRSTLVHPVVILPKGWGNTTGVRRPSEGEQLELDDADTSRRSGRDSLLGSSLQEHLFLKWDKDSDRRSQGKRSQTRRPNRLWHQLLPSKHLDVRSMSCCRKVN